MAFVFSHETRGDLVLDAAHGYVIERPSGIDALTAEFTETRNFTNIGTDISGYALPHRIVNITGIIVGTGQGLKRDALISYFCAGAHGKLQYNGFYLDCYVHTSPSFSGRPYNPRFSLSLLAPDPRWIASEATELELKQAGSYLGGVIDSDFSVPYSIFIDLIDGSFSGLYLTRITGPLIAVSCRVKLPIAVPAPRKLRVMVTMNSAKAVMVREDGSVITDFGECLQYDSSMTELPRGRVNLYFTPPTGVSSYTAKIEYFKTKGGI